MANRVLVVDDEKTIVKGLKFSLEQEGWVVDAAYDGEDALELAGKNRYSMILLDIMLPELNGLEVLRRIRAVSTIPVILETARGETIDKINGLNLGADDYIPKPFEIEELLARINALFRRISYNQPKEATLTYKSLTLNLDRMSFSFEGGEEVQLSKTEFLMLRLFIENQGKVLSRSQVIDEVWGKGHFIDENTVDVYVGYLHSKISDFTKDGYIKTVRGAGYMIV
jgi:two-component system response regulator ArlR